MATAGPLLIFDSGIGGLSVLEPIRRLVPSAPIVYVADSAAYPYGTKAAAELEARVPALLGRLVERFSPELIVIACNTASTIALESVRAALDLPIVGTVPAIKPAAEVSEARVIGVLGTEATVRQAYVDRLAQQFASDCTILRHGSAELVDLAEAKLRGEPTAPDGYARALDGLLSQPQGDRMDTVVLACTHFPLVQDELAGAAGRPLRFIDGAQGIARRVATLVNGTSWSDAPPPGLAVFTARSTPLEPYREGLARFGLTGVERL